MENDTPVNLSPTRKIAAIITSLQRDPLQVCPPLASEAHQAEGLIRSLSPAELRALWRKIKRTKEALDLLYILATCESLVIDKEVLRDGLASSDVRVIDASIGLVENHPYLKPCLVEWLEQVHRNVPKYLLDYAKDVIEDLEEE